ncbi:MAG: site-specific integrase, partial [Acidobacteriota bacterium]
MTPLRQRMIEDMKIRNFSTGTQKLYVNAIARFAQHFGKSPALLGLEEIRVYQLFLVAQKRVCGSTLTVSICALRFLYRITLGKDWDFDRIPIPPKEKKLPVVLSLAEVAQFFGAITNIKHRAILMTAYAAGLRVSEVCALQIEDIDSKRMLIR